MDEPVIDSFRVDSFGVGGPARGHLEFSSMGDGHLRVLLLRGGGRTGKPQIGFEVKFPVSASELAGYLEGVAKSLREAS